MKLLFTLFFWALLPLWLVLGSPWLVAASIRGSRMWRMIRWSHRWGRRAKAIEAIVTKRLDAFEVSPSAKTIAARRVVLLLIKRRDASKARESYWLRRFARWGRR